jgi:hypothetical protein
VEYSTRWLEAAANDDSDDDDSDDDDNDNDNDVSDDVVHMNLTSIYSRSLYREPDSVTQSALLPSTIESK